MRALSIFQRLQPDDPPLDSLSLIAHCGTSLPFSFPIRRSINVDKSDETISKGNFRLGRVCSADLYFANIAEILLKCGDTQTR